MAKGVVNRASCHPLVVTLVNTTLSNKVPDDVHKCPVYLPDGLAELKKRIPFIKPGVDD